MNKAAYNRRTNLENTICSVLNYNNTPIYCDFIKLSYMFKIAGPVIVVGVAVSMLFGFIYYLGGI
jgi:hypothetical protein